MAIKEILMDGDKMCIAFFKKKKYTLTIIASYGTVLGAGTYDTGTNVNIKATANVGYQFDFWSGDLTGKVNPTTITMNANKTVTANFVVIPVVKYTLTTSVNPVDGGTITGAGKYDAGVNVNIEATPAVDYEFDHWSINGIDEPTEVPQPIEIPVGAIFPQDYATGTGTVGDPWAGACIEDAVAACPTEGIIYLKEGYYRLASYVNIKEPMNIIGAGMGKTIVVTAEAHGFYSSGVDYVTIKNMTIDGAAQASGEIPLIYRACIAIGQCEYASLENIEAKNAGRYGIDINTVNHLSLLNIYAHDNYRHGVHSGTQVVGTGNDTYNTYRNIYCWNNGQDGFDGAGSNEGCIGSYNVWDNIQAWDNGGHGIAINYHRNGVLSNSSASRNKAVGIRFYDFDDSDVIDCSTDLSGENGIQLAASSNVNFTNIISKNNTSSGIYINNSMFTKLKLCKSYDDRATPIQDYGLRLYGNTNNVEIINCIFAPNKVDAIRNDANAVVTITND